MSDDHETPNRIPQESQIKIQYGISAEDFNELSKSAQKRCLEHMAARNIGVGKSDNIEQIAEDILQHRFEQSSAAYETYKQEKSEFEQNENQPTNACGDVLDENTGLPKINKEAYEAYKRGL